MNKITRTEYRVTFDGASCASVSDYSAAVDYIARAVVFVDADPALYSIETRTVVLEQSDWQLPNGVENEADRIDARMVQLVEQLVEQPDDDYDPNAGTEFAENHPLTACFHPRSCSKCDRGGKACGSHHVGDSGHERCSGVQVPTTV